MMTFGRSDGIHPCTWKRRHKYDNVRIGINGRLDTLQAAILLAKFDIFPRRLNCAGVAQRYTSLLTLTPLSWHSHTKGYASAWAQYSLWPVTKTTVPLLRNFRTTRSIGYYYPKPLHIQTAFAIWDIKKGDFRSEDCAGAFSLPCIRISRLRSRKNAKVIGDT